MTVSDRVDGRVGVVGFGAFGQLIAGLVCPYHEVAVYDPDAGRKAEAERVGTLSPFAAEVRRDFMNATAVLDRELEARAGLAEIREEDAQPAGVCP